MIFKNIIISSETIFTCSFFIENIYTIISFAFCVIWIIASFFVYIQFRCFQNSDCEEGYTIKNYKEENEAGLNFYVTFVFPLLLDKVIDIQGLLVFFVIIILMVALLDKTDLFYANPILMLLGYKVIRFNFTHNSKFDGKEVIGICPSRINYNKVIKYKIITDAVILMKQNRSTSNDNDNVQGDENSDE